MLVKSHLPMFNLMNMVASSTSIISSYFVKSPMFVVLIPHLLLAKSPFGLLKFTSFLISKHPTPCFPEETTSNSNFSWFRIKSKPRVFGCFTHLPGHLGIFSAHEIFVTSPGSPHLHPAGHSPPGSSTTRDPQPVPRVGLFLDVPWMFGI